MKLRYLFAVLCVYPLLSHAEIYKHVDKDGHVTYSSTPIKGSKKIILEPLTTMTPPARPSATPTPGDFPKVDGATQKNRDDRRLKILEDELEIEEKLLEEAKQNLRTGEETPEVFKVVVGKKQDGSPITETRRNTARYEEKIRTLKEQVEMHQKNIDALKTELSKFK